MQKIPSKARNGTLSVMSAMSRPRSTGKTIPSVASGVPSSRSSALQRGAQVASPEAASLRKSTSPIGKAISGSPEFTSKLSNSTPISPVRCGPPGPPGRDGFDPATTVLPYVVLQADDNSYHRLFIRLVPDSDPAAYTTYVEQAVYEI